MLSSDRRRDSTHAVQVNCILFSKGQPHLCCGALERGLERKSITKRPFATLSEHGKRMARARSEPGRRQYCTCQLVFKLQSQDFTSIRPFLRRSLTTKITVRFHAASLGVSDVQSGSKTEFSLNTSVLWAGQLSRYRD